MSRDEIIAEMKRHFEGKTADDIIAWAVQVCFDLAVDKLAEDSQ